MLEDIASKVKRLLPQLCEIVGADGVIADPDELIVYECDGYTLQKAVPEVVILPRTTEEVSRLVKLLSAEEIPFVPRGAGTSLSGGTLQDPGGVTIALTRMNRILQVDLANRRAVVEPGVVNLHISNAVAAQNLHYAPDPSSQPACTIGGNISTNSGGPHTLKYGVTTNHVLAIEMVLPDGEIVTLGNPTDDCVGYDLRGLAIGSEGTFGIVTKATVRLTPTPEAKKTFLGIFENVDDASQTVSDVIRAGIIPAAMEMMDRLIVGAVETAYKFGFPTDAGAVLIVELDGLAVGLDAQGKRIEEICRKNKAREVRVAKDEAERAALWKCRKRAFGAIGRLSPNYCTQDGVIPRSKLPEMMRFLEGISRKYSLRIANVFHAGDGNLHPLLLYDERDEAQVKNVFAASHEILAKCVEMGGSITGEHGIGAEKNEEFKLMFTADDMDTMLRLRRVFNPNNLCNPNKIFPSSSHCNEMKFRPKKQAAA
jgi:glycolate oxidase